MFVEFSDGSGGKVAVLPEEIAAVRSVKPNGSEIVLKSGEACKIADAVSNAIYSITRAMTTKPESK